MLRLYCDACAEVIPAGPVAQELTRVQVCYREQIRALTFCVKCWERPPQIERALANAVKDMRTRSGERAHERETYGIRLPG